MQELRCSALPRIMACPASSAAPAIRIVSDNDFARMGTAVHEVLGKVVAEGLTTLPDDVDAIADKYRIEELDELRSLSWFGLRAWQKIRAEARVLDVETQMSAEDADLRLTGSPDALAEGEDGALVVVDFKSGYVERDHRHQVMGYLFLASLCHAHDRFTGIVIWIRQGELETFTATRDELAAWYEELKTAAAGDAYSPGDHCTYCPLAHECEARTNLVQTTGSDLVAFENGGWEPTPEAIGLLYPRMKLLEGAIENYKSILKDTIKKNGPVPTGDGRALTYPVQHRDNLYLDRIGTVLVEEFDCSDMAGLVEKMGPDAVKITKRAIEEIAAAGAPKGGIGKAKAAIIEKLRDAGAIVEKSFPKLTLKKELTNG